MREALSGPQDKLWELWGLWGGFGGLRGERVCEILQPNGCLSYVEA